MSDDFSAQERELLAALQAADSPSAEEQLRVKQRTFAQMGLGAVAASSAALSSGVAKAAVDTQALNTAGAAVKTTSATLLKLSGASGLKVALGVAVMLTAGAGAVYLLRTAPRATGADLLVSQSGAEPAARAVILQEAVPGTGSIETVAPEMRPDVSRGASAPEELNPTLRGVGGGPSSTLGRSSLPRETELLSQAHQAIGAGHAREALKLLNEHQRQFPRGTLRIERQGAFALARCLAGELSRGRIEAARFRKQHPISPMNQRLADACGLQ
jgi:hypothetical protein